MLKNCKPPPTRGKIITLPTAERVHIFPTNSTIFPRYFPEYLLSPQLSLTTFEFLVLSRFRVFPEKCNPARSQHHYVRPITNYISYYGLLFFYFFLLLVNGHVRQSRPAGPLVNFFDACLSTKLILFEHPPMLMTPKQTRCTVWRRRRSSYFRLTQRQRRWASVPDGRSVTVSTRLGSGADDWQLAGRQLQPGILSSVGGHTHALPHLPIYKFIIIIIIINIIIIDIINMA